LFWCNRCSGHREHDSHEELSASRKVDLFALYSSEHTPPWSSTAKWGIWKKRKEINAVYGISCNAESMMSEGYRRLSPWSTDTIELHQIFAACRINARMTHQKERNRGESWEGRNGASPKKKQPPELLSWVEPPKGFIGGAGPPNRVATSRPENYHQEDGPEEPDGLP